MSLPLQIGLHGQLALSLCWGWWETKRLHQTAFRDNSGNLREGNEQRPEKCILELGANLSSRVLTSTPPWRHYFGIVLCSNRNLINESYRITFNNVMHQSNMNTVFPKIVWFHALVMIMLTNVGIPSHNNR